MIAALQRPYLAAPSVLVAALAGGAVAAAQPKLALGLVAAIGVCVFVFRAPGISAALLVFITSVAPYGVQNQFGIGGGTASPGLLLSDLLLVGMLAWALPRLARQRMTRTEFRFALAVLAFLAIVSLQFVHGVRAGHELSRAGQEVRALFGIGVFLIVLPLIAEPRERRRLMIGLLVSAVAVGAWGMIQWFGHIQLGAAGDVGVRSGVRLTSAGSGQLQGAEYAYPVVIVICLAGLVGVPYSATLILEIFALQLLLAFTITAFGVMVAARTSQVQSFMALMQMVVMPMFFLSGALFPVAGLPRWLEILNRLDPLTYAVDPMRRAVFAHIHISETARRTLDPGVTWWGWRVPGLLEAALVGLIGLLMLAIAILQFSRTD